MATTETIHVGGFDVEVSRPDKPLFPDGITKSDLAGYYRAAADRMLPHLAGRPLALERYPDGIEGQRLFQKSVPDHYPEWVTRVTVPKQDGTLQQVVADRAATLVYLAGQACLTPHHFLSRTDRLDHPDQLVFDLDPPDAEGFDAARQGALALRGMLEDELGLVSFVKSTGSKGLHVHVPLDRRAPFDEVRDLAREIAGVLVARAPDRFTTEQRRADRGDRVYLDVLRNSYAQTVVAPYAVRARPGAPVARPLHWEEVEDRTLRPDRYRLPDAGRWLADGDPWAGLGRRARKLDGPRTRLAASNPSAG